MKSEGTLKSESRLGQPTKAIDKKSSDSFIDRLSRKLSGTAITETLENETAEEKEALFAGAPLHTEYIRNPKTGEIKTYLVLGDHAIQVPRNTDPKLFHQYILHKSPAENQSWQEYTAEFAAFQKEARNTVQTVTPPKLSLLPNWKLFGTSKPSFEINPAKHPDTTTKSKQEKPHRKTSIQTHSTTKAYE